MGFAGIMAVGAVVFVVGVLWVLVIHDYFFPPVWCVGEGTVLKKWYEPARKKKEYADASGGFGMISSSTRTISESWRVLVKLEDKTESLYITKNLYDSLEAGDKINLNYERSSHPDHIWIYSVRQ